MSLARNRVFRVSVSTDPIREVSRDPAEHRYAGWVKNRLTHPTGSLSDQPTQEACPMCVVRQLGLVAALAQIVASCSADSATRDETGAIAETGEGAQSERPQRSSQSSM